MAMIWFNTQTFTTKKIYQQSFKIYAKLEVDTHNQWSPLIFGDCNK